MSVVFYIDAFIMLIGLIPTLLYALANKSLPTMAGIRLLSGPFESLGIDAMIVAGIVFVVLSAMKVLAAHWLRNARTDSARSSGMASSSPSVRY